MNYYEAPKFSFDGCLCLMENNYFIKLNSIDMSILDVNNDNFVYSTMICMKDTNDAPFKFN